VAGGADGEDLMQDVLLRLVELDRAGHGWDEDKARLGAYVFMVVEQVCLNRHRDAARQKRPSGIQHIQLVSGSRYNDAAGDITTLEEAIDAAILEHGLDDLEAHTLREVASGHKRRGRRAKGLWRKMWGR
jgi:DNA-directed RNA polymerase specialized sigma24 family protein